MSQPTSSTPFGVWRLTFLVAGNIIGSGVFLLPAALARYGSISLFAWGFTTLGALLLAFIFAELSAILGGQGGFYSYCREAFGDFIGFQVAYSYWIALWVGNAALVVALTSYLGLFFPFLKESALAAFIVNISLIWLMTGLNIFYLETMVMLQTILSIVKLLPLLLIAIIGWFYLDFNHFMRWNLSDASSTIAFNEAATMTLWSFLGLESASLSANYLSNPQRDIPRATLWGVALAAIVYIGGYIAIIGMMPFELLIHSTAPYADALQPFLGTWIKQGIGILAILSCFSSLAGWILLQGQMPLAAAQNGLFPSLFLKENKKKVPIAGLIISSSLITLLLLLQLNQSVISQFSFIIVAATFASLIPYFFTSMAAIMLFMKYPDRFKARRFLLVSSLGGIYAFWAIAGVDQSIVFYGCLLLLSSFPVYVGLQWRKKGILSMKSK